MSSIQKLLGPYNICARFAPGYLFLLSIGWICGEVDFIDFESNSILYAGTIIMLSGIVGFMSSSVIKIIESILWRVFGNPTIIYLRFSNNELYKNMVDKYKNDKKILIEILKETRGDDRLFWKNISYGFFRNSIVLVLVLSYLLCQKGFIFYSVAASLFIIFMAFISSIYYAKQAIDSYIELRR